MRKYAKLIAQNTAPQGVNYIKVYNASGICVGRIHTGGLTLPDVGNKLYSFGAISDVHLLAQTADDDLRKALTHFKAEGVDFVCVCGDLSNNGIASEHASYSKAIADCAPDIPVYECTGNHDVYTTAGGILETYTGNPLYYTFEHGDDLFVMFGVYGWADVTGEIFTAAQLQWLYEVLEANRNRRVFVWQHCLRWDGSGKPYPGSPTGNLLNSDKGKVFQSLMEHYKNVVWFHGHSHMDFDSQEDCEYANYDRMHGCHSIHIPSLGLPRDYANSEYVAMYERSEGYVVDAYDNYIVLRGRDFVEGKYLPIATYCIDTTPEEIEAGTYSDSTGTIVT